MDFLTRSLVIIGGVLLAGLILSIVLSGIRRPGRGIGRFFATLGVTVLLLAGTLVLIITMIVRGPSYEAKKLFVTTLLETGNMKWVVGLFLPQEEVNAIVDSNAMGTIEEDTDPDLIIINEELDMGEIKIDRIEGDNYSAIMMIVNDPSRVFVGTTYPWSTYGKELDKLVNSYKATGGVNGGIYDADMNRGGHPYGVVVSEGNIQNLTNLGIRGLVLIGISEDNILKVIDINGRNEAAVRKILTGVSNVCIRYRIIYYRFCLCIRKNYSLCQSFLALGEVHFFKL